MKTQIGSSKLPNNDKPSAVKAGRRRLLKIGATVTPVVLTLSSRSVLACHCRSPSAGGSLTFNSHRPKTGGWDDTGFSINGVKQFDTWIRMDGGLPGGVTKNTKIKDIPTIGPSINTSGLPNGGNTKIKDLPAGFQRDIVTAYLNLNYLPVAQGECITILKLQLMATGNYVDPVNSIQWHKTEIRKYLSDNWLLG